ncbi:MAG: YihY/virulence factor BrkB family protein [Desulfatibacillaceae bacterium]
MELGLRTLSHDLWKMLKDDIWMVRGRDLPVPRRFGLRALRVMVLAVKGFYRDGCMARAAVLTFHMLLSVAPILAVLLGVAKGFGLEERIQTALYQEFPAQEEVLKHLLLIASRVLEQTRGGIVAGLGVAVLLWAVIRIWMQMEEAFNEIWRVPHGRSIPQRAVDYMAATVISPVLWLASTASAVYITATVRTVTEAYTAVQPLGPVIITLLSWLPYAVIWILLSFVYIFIPNTRIRWSSGILAGVIAGTAYQLFQWVYIEFQIGVSRYNAVYGSFAALPLFLIWLNISWMIVLLGAELSYAFQNADNYEFEPNTRNMSHGLKMTLALWITHYVARAFDEGRDPPGSDEISRALDMPHVMADPLLNELVDAGVLIRAQHGKRDDIRYHPARPLEKLTMLSIMESLEKRGDNALSVGDSEVLDRIMNRMEEFSEALREKSANTPIVDV